MNTFYHLFQWILSLFGCKSQSEPEPQPEDALIEHIATECELLELPVPRNQIDHLLIGYDVWDKATDKLELPVTKEVKKTSKEIVKTLTNGDIIAIKRMFKPLPSRYNYY